MSNLGVSIFLAIFLMVVLEFSFIEMIDGDKTQKRILICIAVIGIIINLL